MDKFNQFIIDFVFIPVIPFVFFIVTMNSFEGSIFPRSIDLRPFLMYPILGFILTSLFFIANVKILKNLYPDTANFFVRVMSRNKLKLSEKESKKLFDQ